ATKILADHDTSLYQRGRKLVTIILKPATEHPLYRMELPPAPVIEVLDEAVLRLQLTEFARIIKMEETRDGIEEVPAHPTPWLVSGLARYGSWEGIRDLRAVVSTPTLLPDGSVLQQAGYHQESGLFMAADGEYPTIPSSPTIEDARRSLAALLVPVHDFPF